MSVLNGIQPIRSFNLTPEWAMRNHGQPFRCKGCGECCKHLVGKRFGMAILPETMRVLKAYSDKHELGFNPAPLTREYGVVTLYQFTQSECPFHDTHNKKCRVYERRPLVCRMFPLHPYAVMTCFGLDRQVRTDQVQFSPEMETAVKLYSALIDSKITSAHEVYDLNRGWVPKGKHRVIMQRLT